MRPPPLDDDSLDRTGIRPARTEALDAPFEEGVSAKVEIDAPEEGAPALSDEPGVLRDLAHAQRRVAVLRETAERGVEDLRLRVAEVGVGDRDRDCVHV